MTDQNSPKMDDLTALGFAFEEFEKRHPRETRPPWLKRCMMESYHKDKEGRYVYSFTLTPKEPLGPDEHWEEIYGKKWIVKVDQLTGKKMVVLHRIPREIITIFQAVVDPKTADVEVLIDLDISEFVGEELEGF